MHLCLELDHIQLEIFQYVYAPQPWYWIMPHSGDRTSLASLAATCRAFYENAMDLLWSELDSLAPLVMCMPCDVWHVQKAQVSWPTPFSSYGRGLGSSLDVPCPDILVSRSSSIAKPLGRNINLHTNAAWLFVEILTNSF